MTNDKAGPAGRSKWFIAPRSVITANEDYIKQWQVVVSSAHPGGQEGRDNQLAIVDNNSAFGRARVALASFKSYEEAKNFYDYVNSSIIRYTFLMTDEALSSLGKLVPDIGNYHTENDYIDFHDNIDEQLAGLLGLTDDEYQYIQKVVNNVRRS